MGVLSPAEKQMLEDHLRRYDIYRRRVDDHYATLDSVRRPEVASSSNLPGNPTEHQALAAVEPPDDVRLAQRWLEVHRMTADRLDEEHREFMRAVFYRGTPRLEAMANFAVEESTYHRWVEEVTITFALCAAIKRMAFVDAKTPGVFTVNSVV